MAIYSPVFTHILHFVKDVHMFTSSDQIPLSTRTGTHFVIGELLPLLFEFLKGDYKSVPPNYFMKNPNNAWIILLSSESYDITTPGDIPNTIETIKKLTKNKRVFFITQHQFQYDYISKQDPSLKLIGNYSEWEWFSFLRSKKWPVKNTTNYEKRFAFANRRNNSVRSKMFYNMWTIPNFPENSYTSFNPGNYWSTIGLSKTDADANIKSIWDHAMRDLHDPAMVEWFKTSPFPQLPSKYSEQDPIKYDWYGDGLGELIHDTGISIISESVPWPVHQQLFATEKLYRTIIVGQPFIVLAHPYYLKNLKLLGYKTFENIWDESYDDIEDLNKRILKIRELVDWLIKLPDVEFKKLLEQASDICAHNRATIIDRCTYSRLVNEIGEPFKSQLNKDPNKISELRWARCHVLGPSNKS